MQCAHQLPGHRHSTPSVPPPQRTPRSLAWWLPSVCVSTFALQILIQLYLVFLSQFNDHMLSSNSFPLATQTLSQRPAGASATAAPVRTMPQYKYAAGVRNPQQHMASQPQVTMQQVRNLLGLTFLVHTNILPTRTDALHRFWWIKQLGTYQPEHALKGVAPLLGTNM